MTPPRAFGLVIGAQIIPASSSDREVVFGALSPDGETVWPSESDKLGRSLSDAVRACLPAFGLDRLDRIQITPGTAELIDLKDSDLRIHMTCTVRIRTPEENYSAFGAMLRDPSCEDLCVGAVRRAIERLLAKCPTEAACELVVERGCIEG